MAKTTKERVALGLAWFTVVWFTLSLLTSAGVSIYNLARPKSKDDDTHTKRANNIAMVVVGFTLSALFIWFGTILLRRQ